MLCTFRFANVFSGDLQGNAISIIANLDNYYSLQNEETTVLNLDLSLRKRILILSLGMRWTVAKTDCDIPRELLFLGQ